MTTPLRRPRRPLARATVLLAATLAAGSAFAFCVCLQGTIIVKKFYDANANGIHDAGEPRLSNWPMTLQSATQSLDSTRLTDAFGYASWSGLAVGGDYTMREGTPQESNWVQSSPVDGSGNPINPQANIKVLVGKTTQLTFGNYCTKPGGGRTPGFWSNRNGLAKMMDGLDGTGSELALLSSLNLVDANGVAFDPGNYGDFRTWLLASTATNMAYKLSSHLAAMQLNVEAGFVNGNRVYAPFGGTINELMALANASLGSDPFTPAGHPERGYQEQLKDYLDALNNGAAVVSPTPCARTFSSGY